MSEYISTNSGIHHQFRIYYKGGKASQLLKGFVWATCVSDMKIIHKIRSERFQSVFSPLFQYTRNTCIAETREARGGGGVGVGGNQKIKGLET